MDAPSPPQQLYAMLPNAAHSHFCAVGMLSGSDGFGIEFENIQLANAIGTVALCIILFRVGWIQKW